MLWILLLMVPASAFRAAPCCCGCPSPCPLTIDETKCMAPPTTSCSQRDAFNPNKQLEECELLVSIWQAVDNHPAGEGGSLAVNRNGDTYSVAMVRPSGQQISLNGMTLSEIRKVKTNGENVAMNKGPDGVQESRSGGSSFAWSSNGKEDADKIRKNMGSMMATHRASMDDMMAGHEQMMASQFGPDEVFSSVNWGLPSTAMAAVAGKDKEETKKEGEERTELSEKEMDEELRNIDFNKLKDGETVIVHKTPGGLEMTRSMGGTSRGGVSVSHSGNVDDVTWKGLWQRNMENMRKQMANIYKMNAAHSKAIDDMQKRMFDPETGIFGKGFPFTNTFGVRRARSPASSNPVVDPEPLMTKQTFKRKFIMGFGK